MQKLFNAAALEGGYYNTAALEGGAYNEAALVGGSDIYNDAAIIGGFALAELATSDTPPTLPELSMFGIKTFRSLPPTVRDTIYKMFNPKTEEEQLIMYGALALLYLLDSLKALSIAPEVDLPTRNLARQRWAIAQHVLQAASPRLRRTYNRLLRYIHIPHSAPRSCQYMKKKWLAAINSRTRPWGRSSAWRALPRMPSTTGYDPNVTWEGPYIAPEPTPSRKRKRGTKIKVEPRTKKPRKIDEVD